MVNRVIVFILLVLLCAVFLFPFFWMFLTTVKSDAELFMYPPAWFPQEWQWQNYEKTFQAVPFFRYTLNSFIISLANVGAVFFSCSFAAFGLTRYNIKGKEFIFGAIVASMIIPINIIILPQYLIFNSIRWLDTYLPLIVPSFLGYSMGTFLLRQFFMTIPKDLDDAAKIDGAGALSILLRVYVPLSTGAFITIGIFIFIFWWNDLLRPVIFLSSTSKMPLTVGLINMMGQYTVQWNLLMCGAFLSIIPAMIIFLIAQKYYIQGIAMTALKG
jgi:ABC-type glycerol-3-phosphate transport system permease component